MNEKNSLVPVHVPSISESPFHFLERLTIAFEECSDNIRRIADHFCPSPDAIVGTKYLSMKLGVTKERISQMVREGDIPQHCLVEGTGGGKPWKFHRRPIEQWIRGR